MPARPAWLPRNWKRVLPSGADVSSGDVLGAEHTVAATPAASRAAPDVAAAAKAAPVDTARVDAPTAVRARAAEADRTDKTDEATLMSQLRALVHTAPEQALALARRGDALFPNSPDAPERAWSVVKSLDLLKRFHEAQA